MYFLISCRLKEFLTMSHRFFQACRVSFCMNLMYSQNDRVNVTYACHFKFKFFLTTILMFPCNSPLVMYCLSIDFDILILIRWAKLHPRYNSVCRATFQRDAFRKDKRLHSSGSVQGSAQFRFHDVIRRSTLWRCANQ